MFFRRSDPVSPGARTVPREIRSKASASAAMVRLPGVPDPGAFSDPRFPGGRVEVRGFFASASFFLATLPRYWRGFLSIAFILLSIALFMLSFFALSGSRYRFETVESDGATIVLRVDRWTGAVSRCTPASGATRMIC